MRANIRGSIRNVMVTDSESSLAAATADSINRKSGRFSDQNSASADSLSNIGTSSQLAMERMLIVFVGTAHLTLQEIYFDNV